MRLHFDEAFDGEAWPGVQSAAATAGEVWAGPLGTLGWLETLTGLARNHASASVRIAETMRALGSTAGFWSESFKADGLATARTVLALRDELLLRGWSGTGAGERLDAMVKALLPVSAGPVERLRALELALPRYGAPLEQVRLFQPADALPALWLKVLRAAAKRLNVEPTPAPTAPEGSNLRAAATGVFAPHAEDRSLQLIRPFGPLAAADAVATALAATREVPTVILGADAVLDAALHRHRLPTTGASGGARDNALCEVLPLVIALGAKTPNPDRALELLTLPTGPIRRIVARKLVQSLQRWPAVHSTDWTDALNAAAQALETDADRATLHERVVALLDGNVDDLTRYPVAELRIRTQALGKWLRGLVAHENDADRAARLDAALTQVLELESLVASTALTTLEYPQLRRFLEQVRSGGAGPGPFPAQAGLGAIARPGGLTAPVERVVWWNFTRSSFPAPRRLPLLPEERLLLEKQGVALPTPGALATRAAELARRPLLLASRTLWLVAPGHEPNGDEAAPHPLWDEIAARVNPPKQLVALVSLEPRLDSPLVKVRRALLPTLQPRAEWLATSEVRPREVESPSSVELRLGCSLSWALKYAAGLWPGETATLPTGARLLGNLSHRLILERLLKGEFVPETAGETVTAQFDVEGPMLAAPLFLSGGDAERAQARDAIRLAAGRIGEWVSSGWRVASTETELKGRAFGVDFAGTPDLVLERDGRRAVIDLKWGSSSYRREVLRRGVALQLAAYVELLRQNGWANAAAGYFVLATQQLWTADDVLPGTGGALKTAATTQETWKQLEAAAAAQWKDVSQGRLTAPGTYSNAPEESSLEPELSVHPPCRFCEYGGVCGKRYATIEVRDGQD